jgi:hypothetical protein
VVVRLLQTWNTHYVEAKIKARLKYGGRRHPSVHPLIHPFIPRLRNPINLIRDLTNPNPPLLVCLSPIFSSLLETDICRRKKTPQKKKKGAQSSRRAPFLSVKKYVSTNGPLPIRPPKATSFRVGRARHRAHSSIAYSLSNGLSPPHPPVPPPPNDPSHPMCNFLVHHFYPNTILTSEKHHSTRPIPDPTLLTHFITSLFLSPPG